MAIQHFFDFDNSQTVEDFWDFVGSQSNGISNNGGSWNRINNGSTPSNSTGPSAGQNNDGYIYTETSSPHSNGGVFTMTTKTAIDATVTDISLSYWYNCYTDVAVTCDVQFWDGTQWNTEDTITPADVDLVDVWYQRSITVNTYNNTDCFIRFVVTTPNSGTSYRKDFALDSITLDLADAESDGFIDYFKNFGLFKKSAWGQIFLGEGKTNNEVKSIIASFLANILTFDFTKYPKGIVIKEDQNIIHVITEKDKG